MIIEAATELRMAIIVIIILRIHLLVHIQLNESKYIKQCLNILFRYLCFCINIFNMSNQSAKVIERLYQVKKTVLKPKVPGRYLPK